MEILEIKSKIKKYQKKYKTKPLLEWQGVVMARWEHKLLFDIGAINDKGIIKDRPVVIVIERNGGQTTIDLDGDINRLMTAKDDFNIKKGSDRASIVYIPRTYANFQEAKKIIDEEKEKAKYAKEINTPPIGEQDPVAMF